MTIMSPNFLAEDNSPRIRSPAAVFCVFTPLVVATRFWSRRQTKSVLGADDWTILGSMIFELADCSVLLTACSFGFGKHSATLTASNKFMALKVRRDPFEFNFMLFYCSQVLYKISLNLTKVSILLLYLRAFNLKPFRIVCWTLMGIVAAYGLAATVATVLQCAPIARAWNKTLPGKCFNITAFWYANASYTIATDLVLLILPMRVIWGLQLRTMQKAAVLMVFAMGGLVTIFSIIRTTTLVASATSTDPTYDIESTSWANIEANIAILCACLPIFRRPLALLFPRVFSTLGDHPASPSRTEDHTIPHVETDRSQWMYDDSKMSRARYGATRPIGTYPANACNDHRDDSVLEHVEDVKVGLS